jgi:hypothetical protein
MCRWEISSVFVESSVDLFVLCAKISQNNMVISFKLSLMHLRYLIRMDRVHGRTGAG